MRIIFIALCVVASTRAYADPRPKVVHVPTADLQGSTGVHATAGVGHRKGLFGQVTVGVGRFAEFGVDYDDATAACEVCAGAGAQFHAQQALGARFKVGAEEHQFFRHQPAVALGFERTVRDLQASDAAGGIFSTATVADLFLALAKEVGPLRLHGGVQLWDLRVDRDRVIERLRDAPLGQRIRPFAGLAWTPGLYPKTTILTDFSFAPVLGPAGSELGWLLGWGVRYRVVKASSVELLVRHREGDSLGGATVMVRLNVSLGH